MQARPSNRVLPVIVSALMMDNSRPERPRGTLMPPIGVSSRQAHGAPFTSAAPPLRPGVVSNEADFLAALPVIDDVAGQVCRRHRLNSTEADDFKSDVRLHFIERNYEVLRKFEGRCALSTYVNVVVQRLFLDWRNRMWGRWRPSVEAKRLGPTAMLIERLIARDGWTIDQTIEMLRVNHQVELDDTLRAFCDNLSTRGPSRRLVSEEDASEMPSPGPLPDANVVKAERDFLAKRVQAALDRARQGLPAMERLILKMRFDDRVAVSDIARALHLEQRPLYRTIERLLKTIGEAMKAEGISLADIDALFNGPSDEDGSTGAWYETDKGPDTGPQGNASVRTERKGASWRSR
jgi:RNA polymerase sigma factor (sigma-70 family)